MLDTGKQRTWHKNQNRMSKIEVIPLSVKVWGLRLLIVIAIVFVCAISRSSAPALALMIVWGPMGLFYVGYTRGYLRLPRFLQRVRRLEPTIYRLLGVGLVKIIVANRLWPMVNGFDPPEQVKIGQDSLDRAEQRMVGAEVTHGTAFIVMLPIALCYLAANRIPESISILILNVVLHAYPVMLQRANRWRIQQVLTKFK
jgi:hypothetical protein